MATKAPSPPYVGPAARHGDASNKPINRIVIHCTVSPCVPGGARNVARMFRTTTRPASAHYVVDPKETVQVVFDSVVAYHAPPNQHALGIELCDMQSGPGSRWKDDNHQAMLARAAKLVAGLCLAYDVPITRIGPGELKAGKRGICGHIDVSHAWGQTSHIDPEATPGFPWADLMAAIRKEARALTNPQASAPKPVTKPKPTGHVPAAVTELRAALKTAKPVNRVHVEAALAELSKIR
jgi:N-acetylmuramoyl-L-alanine amidase CwlA